MFEHVSLALRIRKINTVCFAKKEMLTATGYVILSVTLCKCCKVQFK